jgi:hypothetical protein
MMAKVRLIVSSGHSLASHSPANAIGCPSRQAMTRAASRLGCLGVGRRIRPKAAVHRLTSAPAKAEFSVWVAGSAHLGFKF